MPTFRGPPPSSFSRLLTENFINVQSTLYCYLYWYNWIHVSWGRCIFWLCHWRRFDSAGPCYALSLTSVHKGRTDRRIRWNTCVPEIVTCRHEQETQKYPIKNKIYTQGNKITNRPIQRVTCTTLNWKLPVAIVRICSDCPFIIYYWTAILLRLS